MFGTPRAKVRLRRAWIRAGGSDQFGALLLAVIVAALVQVPFAADQVAEALPPQSPTELVGQRTATARTFDNHDGTYTTALYSGPVHYRDPQGDWRPISSAVVPTTESGYGLENEANRFRTFFKSTLANDFLALDTGGGRFKVTLQNAAQVAAQAGPRRVTYPGVFSGVDLRYDLRPDGVKETLLLQNAQAPTSYRFLLTPPANARIHAAQGADGSWAFFMAPHARPVFVIDAPWAAENDEPVASRSNASLAVTRVGDVFQLDLSVNGTWLRAPGRQFPVRLDPTITIQPTIQDASFDFGCLGCAGVSSDRLSIGTVGLSTKWRSALQYSLADIPAGASVSSAKLKLYFDGTCLIATGTCGGTSHQIDALRITNSWSPSSKTSQITTAPISPTPSFTLPAGASAQWMNWDITGTVQTWANGQQSNFGLLLKRATEPANASGPKPPSRNYPAEPTLGPTLEVTYNGVGGELLEPETVHANGAELRWIPYGGPGAPPFSSYEVHRSTNPVFTPSDSTRLTKILDSAVKTYRDTTAKAGGTFTYKVVVDGYETNSRTVPMPVAGEARKILRPDPAAGRQTYVTFRSDYTECINRGEAERLKVGTDTNSIFRALLQFDLGEMPSNTTVTQATLSLWHPETSGASALTIRAHRLTGTWPEGTGKADCTGDGPTWYETKGGVDWLNQGGDFDPAVVGTISVPAAQPAGWNTLNIASLAQQWARGEQPNQGLIFKLDNETIGAGKFVDYYADDFSVAPTLRPKLSLTYTETTSASVAPRVYVSKPRVGALVKGTSVQLAAATWDDRRVDSVQFFVDGNSVGTDTSEPFSINWNSTSVGNGTHNVTARATDDAGSQTTSGAVSVTVGNSAPPTTSITSPVPPPDPPVVTGTINVTANANDDFGVTKVELYADGLLVGTDTTSPYSFSWNTLDAALPAYDGLHTLSTKAYDAHGQMGTSADVSVKVDNRKDSWYDAEITTSTVFPAHMVFDRSGPQQPYTFDVQVMNTGTQTLPAATVALHYRWLTADTSQPVPDGDGPEVLFPFDLEPSQAQTVQVIVEPPNVPIDRAREDYRLRFDLFDATNQTNTWFAEHGNKPLDGFVPVGVFGEEEALGVEPYFEYEREELGLGMENLVNVATGNSVVRWTPWSAPGIGLSTDLELSYNSLDQRHCAPPSRCPIGPGWSLSISNLVRFGAFQFDRGSFVDSDGTWKEFDCNGGVCTPPGGTHLYVREVSRNDLCPGHEQQQATWAATRPDRVTYYYDPQGGNGHPTRPVAVRDKNGNELCFKTGQPPGDRVEKVYDEAGRYFELTYGGEGAPAKVIGIKDHLQHELQFSYQDGRLASIVEVGGTNADGSPLPDRRVEFEYTADGQLEYVHDPLGEGNPNRRTRFVYNAGKLTSRTDRVGAQTTFDYNVGASETTIIGVPALKRVRKYHYLTTPRDRYSVDAITRYRDYPDQNSGETTQTVWTPATPPDTCTLDLSPARHVWKVIEPGGAYTERCYNQNGLVTDDWDQLRNHTEYTYENSCVDDSPVDTQRSISDLVSRRTPEGPTWTYEYYRVPSVCTPPTMSNGNLHKAVDPPAPNQGTMTFIYDQANNWNLATVLDANNNPTEYRDYDANGFPTRVTDAEGNVTKYSYNADGLQLTLQEPLHEDGPSQFERLNKTVYDYDSFHRLGRESTPKSTRFEYGTLMWQETRYDANNNVVGEVQPYYGSDPRLETHLEYDAMDRETCSVEPLPPQPGSDQPEIRLLEYDLAGRLTRTTAPKGLTAPPPPEICPSPPQGNDYVTESVYDAIDRVITERSYDENGVAERKGHYCYQHNTGDLLWVIAPNANRSAAPDSCNDQNPELPSHLTRYTYDAAHRTKTETTQAGSGQPLRTRELFYDQNGNVTREDDERDTKTEYHYTARDELETTIQTFDAQQNPARKLTTYLKYDNAGNLILEASPRAWDKEADPDPDPDPIPPDPGDDYVVEYRYNEVGRVNRIAMPDDGNNTRTYIHQAYDANGNLKTTTLPVDVEEIGALCQTEPDKCTELGYWDEGLIRTSEDHIVARVLYDYTAEGWQKTRFSQHAQGEAMSWRYAPDGMLSRAIDRQGHPAQYFYDRNDNLKTAIEAGSQGREPLTLTIESDYNGYNEPTKTRIKEAGDPNWRFSRYTYDRNGNVDVQREDGLETGPGVELEPPRVYDFAYDEVDELTEELDLGTDNGQASEGDRQLTLNYEVTGWQKDETLARHTSGSWAARRSTAWAYFDNGDLRTQTTRRGSVTDPDPQKVIEKHTLDYEQCLDPDVPCLPTDELYVNGNPTRDEFQLAGPNGYATGCEGIGICALDYKYGPRENLVREKRSRVGSTPTWTCHTFDPAQNMVKEWLLVRTLACNPTEDDPTRRFTYLRGNRLETMTDEIPDRTHRYFYDDDGNLDCVTSGAWALSSCPAAAGQGAPQDPALEKDLDWHYSGKIASYRRFDSGTEIDRTDYDHDPLDRLYEEAESHGELPTIITNLFYRGPTDSLRSETASGEEKVYTYGPGGGLLALDSGPAGGTPTKSRAYAANGHTDISLLLSLDASASQVKASYGYRPYGGEDASLTRGISSEVQQNAYRFNAMRLDTGSSTLDMGARRYDTDYGRFIAQDSYSSAAEDLGLTIDSLTQNRYAYGASNPIGEIEFDGHRLAPGGPAQATSPPHIQDYLNRHRFLNCGDAFYEEPQNREDCIRLRQWIEECKGCPRGNAGLWLVDFVPVLGEIKGGIECINNPGPWTCAGAIPVAGKVVRGARAAKAASRELRKYLKATKAGPGSQHVEWVRLRKLPGGHEEQESILGTLKHIDEETVPAGPISKSWGTPYENAQRPPLPGPRNVRGSKSPFREYRVPPPGSDRRIVVDTRGPRKKAYYTWNHYGRGERRPAFVRLR
jgi:RHS repeat-associated protein